MIAAAIILLMGAAMLASFGRSLFALNTPQVILPASSAGPGNVSDPENLGQNYYRVEVTPQTVTGVVSTLVRPSSYYRELTVETFWAGGSSATQVQTWTDGGWTHSRQVLPSGAVRHDLTDGNDLYYWYDGSQQYEHTQADERSSDLAQHIPTYETVLDLDPQEITDAGYETRGGRRGVYAGGQRGRSQQLQRFWVSTDNGLLVCAESEENGQLIYRMTSYSSIQSPCPSEASFTLPTGELPQAARE